LIVPYFLPTDDPLESINKALAFMCTTFASSCPSNNTQLETSKAVSSTYEDIKFYLVYGKMLLAQVQEAWIALSKEHLAILADTGDKVDSHLRAYKVTTNAIFHSDGIDSYNSYCDEVPTAQASFMANLSNYAQRINPTLYDGNMLFNIHPVISVNDEEETLILEEETRSKMTEKQNDSISKEKKVNITPIDYAKLNQLSEDFGKRFVLQMQLSAEQAFWLSLSNHNFEQPNVTQIPVRVEVHKELLKISLVNTSVKS
ncbi:hypothetical protein Tco_1230711, partial [Tanacetum coccineum]